MSQPPVNRRLASNLGHPGPAPTPTHKPNDNRPGPGTATATTVLFPAGQRNKIVPFTITSRQPGNNYKVGSTSQAPEIGHVEFKKEDGTILLQVYVNGSVPAVAPLAGGAVSGILTVWRTLHVELDSMELPTLWDENSPITDDDVFPDFPSLLPTGALREFERANVKPVADLEEWDLRNTVPFIHNFDHTEPSQRGAASTAFEVTNDADFWVAHVLTGYDGRIGRDNDDNSEDADFGWRYSSSNAIVYTEALRDDRAEETSLNTDPATSYEDMLAIAVRHEVAHMFIGDHSMTSGDITYEGALAGVDWFMDLSEYAFTPRQLGRIQAAQKPN